MTPHQRFKTKKKKKQIGNSRDPWEPRITRIPKSGTVIARIRMREMGYHWPGNYRALRRCTEQAPLRSIGGPLRPLWLDHGFHLREHTRTLPGMLLKSNASTAPVTRRVVPRGNCIKAHTGVALRGGARRRPLKCIMGFTRRGRLTLLTHLCTTQTNS